MSLENKLGNNENNSFSQHGLLYLAEKTKYGSGLISPFLEFSSLFQSEFDSSGLLFYYNNYYRLILANNLSEKTLTKCIATHSFWEGTLPTTNDYLFSETELAQFYQLFSSDDLQSSSFIFLKKTKLSSNSEFIFFGISDNSYNISKVLASKINTYLIKYDEKIRYYYSDKIIPIESSLIKQTIADNLQKKWIPTILKFDFTSIFLKYASLSKIDDIQISNVLYNSLSKKIHFPDLVYKQESNIFAFLIFTREKTNAKMLAQHILNSIQNFFIESDLSLIKFISCIDESNPLSIFTQLTGKIS